MRCEVVEVRSTKIALIRREYIMHLDGVNKFIALLAEGLRRLGHEVENFTIQVLKK